MILLDATALIALFLDEPAATKVQHLLRAGKAGITSVNLAETIDVLGRVFGHDIAVVEDALVPLLVNDVAVINVDERVARASARIRIENYHSKDMPLSMADCILLGAAQSRGDSIATADGLVAQVGRSEGLDVIALPDSSGRLPSRNA